MKLTHGSYYYLHWCKDRAQWQHGMPGRNHLSVAENAVVYFSYHKPNKIFLATAFRINDQILAEINNRHSQYRKSRVNRNTDSGMLNIAPHNKSHRSKPLIIKSQDKLLNESACCQ